MQHDSEFLKSLRSLARRVRRADPSLYDLAYFDTPTDSELVQLRRSVLELAREAESAVRALSDTLIPKLSETPLSDLASIVRSDVGAALFELESKPIDDSSTWELGMAAVQVLSRVLKGATALENAYCQELGIQQEISLVAELRIAIEIRQAYASFWHSIESRPPATQEELRMRLRRGSTSIAKLRGREIFLDLRHLDRHLLLQLQRRILAWFASGGASEEGRGLWHELVAFAELLQMINQRSELLEHDAAMVPQLADELSTLPAEKALPIDAAVLSRARTLEGLDQALDELLAGKELISAGELRSALAPLLETWRLRQARSA